MAREPHHPTSRPPGASPCTTQSSPTPGTPPLDTRALPPGTSSPDDPACSLPVARVGNVYKATAASAANVSRGTCTFLRPSSPTLGTAETLPPDDSPPITTPFDGSSSKVIDVPI